MYVKAIWVVLSFFCGFEISEGCKCQISEDFRGHWLERFGDPDYNVNIDENSFKSKVRGELYDFQCVDQTGDIMLVHMGGDLYHCNQLAKGKNNTITILSWNRMKGKAGKAPKFWKKRCQESLPPWPPMEFVRA